MSASAHLQRGNLLRSVAWLVAGVGAAVLVTVLVATRGGKIRKELEGAGEQIKASLPAVPDLSDLPVLPGSGTGNGSVAQPADPDAAPADPQQPSQAAGAADPQPAGPEGTPSENGAQPRPGQSGGTAAREPEPTPTVPAYTVKNPPPVARARHTVVKGETLYSLAETYYEDGSLWRLIAEANGLKSPAELREGMEVLIPGR